MAPKLLQKRAQAARPKLCADENANTAALASAHNGSSLTSIPVYAWIK